MKEKFDEELFQAELKAVLMPVHGLSNEIVHSYHSNVDDYKNSTYKIGFPLNLTSRRGKIITRLKFKNSSIHPNRENIIWHRIKRLISLSRKI